jgi:hypothetical protein
VQYFTCSINYGINKTLGWIRNASPQQRNCTRRDHHSGVDATLNRGDATLNREREIMRYFTCNINYGVNQTLG